MSVIEESGVMFISATKLLTAELFLQKLTQSSTYNLPHAGTDFLIPWKRMIKAEDHAINPDFQRDINVTNWPLTSFDEKEFVKRVSIALIQKNLDNISFEMTLSQYIE